VAETKVKTEDLEERADERLRKPRTGLSINDTIAGNANLSVGSRGVDTSGVEAGAGAGAGSTYVTPGATGSSPAPNIVSGPRSTGTTPRGGAPAEEDASVRLDTKSKLNETGSASRDEISARAYHRWHQRGCPDGSPEVDWHAAEDELKTRR
jgi:Protein of unknown function (DUF2934)